jgi:hypothetical protein
MKVVPNPSKPVDPAKELSLILTEGQREGEIEVLQIDETMGSVKVSNSGTVMMLTFENDGAKSLPARPTPPGAPPLPNPLPAGAGGTANLYALPSPGGPRGPSPTRTHRTQELEARSGD